MAVPDPTLSTAAGVSREAVEDLLDGTPCVSNPVFYGSVVVMYVAYFHLLYCWCLSMFVLSAVIPWIWLLITNWKLGLDCTSWQQKSISTTLKHTCEDIDNFPLIFRFLTLFN